MRSIYGKNDVLKLLFPVVCMVEPNAIRLYLCAFVFVFVSVWYVLRAAARSSMLGVSIEEIAWLKIFSEVFFSQSCWVRLYGARIYVFHIPRDYTADEWCCFCCCCWKLTSLPAIFMGIFLSATHSIPIMLLLLFFSTHFGNLENKEAHVSFCFALSVSVLCYLSWVFCTFATTKCLWRCPTVSWSCVCMHNCAYISLGMSEILHSIKCLQIIFNLFLINGTRSLTPGTHAVFFFAFLNAWINFPINFLCTMN